LLASGNTQMDTMVESAADTVARTYLEFAHALSRGDASWLDRQQTFVVGFRAFSAALDSWKHADSQRLLATMERHYLELDRLWQTVQRRASGNGDEEWRVGIQAQREDLLRKIRVLGGSTAADNVVQRQNGLRSTYSDPQPSHTPSLASEAATMTSGTSAEPGPGMASSTSVESDSGIASDTLAGPGSGVASGTSAVPDKGTPPTLLAKAVLDPASQDVDRILGSYNLTASAALENAKIAHELILDPDIRLASAAMAGEPHQARGRFVDTYVESVRRGAEAGNQSRLVHALEQLHVEMRTIIPSASPMREALDKELDNGWMESQLAAGALDVPEKLLVALRLIRSVCAPARDQAVRDLQERVAAIDGARLLEAAGGAGDDAAKQCIGEVVDCVRGIFSLISDQRMDVLNYQLDTVVRPWLRAHAVEYERSKMEKALGPPHGNNPTAAKAIDWMRPAADRMRSEQTAGDCTAAKRVFREALLDLCFAPTALQPDKAPITLALDQERIQALQNDIQVLVSTAALCALAKATMQRRGTPIGGGRLRQAAQTLLGCLRSDDVGMDNIVSEVCSVVDVQGNSAGDGGSLIARLVRKTLSKADPVFQKTEEGLRRFIAAEIASDETPKEVMARLRESGQRVRASLARTSLDAVDEDVCALVCRIARLCDFNWQVYSPWYMKIV
ncbi:hypothetical protein GGF46_001774, partial [Coemansia sp. RSA 552]